MLFTRATQETQIQLTRVNQIAFCELEMLCSCMVQNIMGKLEIANDNLNNFEDSVKCQPLIDYKLNVIGSYLSLSRYLYAQSSPTYRKSAADELETI